MRKPEFSEVIGLVLIPRLYEIRTGTSGVRMGKELNICMTDGIAMLIGNPAVDYGLRMQAKHQVFGIEAVANGNIGGIRAVLVEALKNVPMRLREDRIGAGFRSLQS